MSPYYVSIYLYPNTPNPSFAGLKAPVLLAFGVGGSSPTRPNVPNTW